MALRQQAAQLRGAARAERLVASAAHLDRPRFRLAQPCQRIEQGGLAGTVAAEDGHALPRFEVEAEARGDAHGSNVYIQITDGQ